METSAKDNMNIAEAFKVIINSKDFIFIKIRNLYKYYYERYKENGT
jgi:hypothetical protein